MEDDPSEAKQMRLRYAGTCTVVQRLFPPGPPPSTTGAPRRPMPPVSRCPRNRRRPPVVPTSTRPPSPRQWKVRSTSRAAARVPHASGHRWRVRAASSSVARRREDRVRAAHPKIGGLILALSGTRNRPAPESGRGRGERLGARLDSLTSDGVAVLHDNASWAPAPTSTTSRSRATASGSSTPSATRDVRPCAWKAGSCGRVSNDSRWSPRLHQARRRRHQAGRARDEALADEGLDAPVKGALAFVDADWPWSEGPSPFAGSRAVAKAPRQAPRGAGRGRGRRRDPRGSGAPLPTCLTFPRNQRSDRTTLLRPEAILRIAEQLDVPLELDGALALGMQPAQLERHLVPPMSNDGSDRRLRSSRSRRQTWPGHLTISGQDRRLGQFRLGQPHGRDDFTARSGARGSHRLRHRHGQ